MYRILEKVKYSILLLIPIIFMGVKCDRPESIGPNYILAPSDFTVNSYSAASPTVNFGSPAGTKIGFNASFSDSVSWTLKLVGLTSGAVKEITGTSTGINTTNPKWLWDGAHQGLYFFMKNEKVEATLTFLGSSYELRDTITILGTKVFKNVLLSDFEIFPTPPSTTVQLPAFPTWVYGPSGAYAEATPDPGSGGGFLDTSMADPNNPSLKFKPVQGVKAYNLYGTDANSSYFVAGVRRGGLPVGGFPLDPTQLYLNVYIYGTGDPNSKLNFGAQEDDGDIDPGAGNGVHDAKNDDEFQVQISVDHVGWKLFSFKYSDLARTSDPLNGGNGDNVHEPREITGIPFGLISAPPKNTVRVIFDFPIITYGAPFDPNN